MKSIYTYLIVLFLLFMLLHTPCNYTNTNTTPGVWVGGPVSIVPKPMARWGYS